VEKLIGMGKKNPAAAAQMMYELIARKIIEESDMLVALTCRDPSVATAIIISLS
jgi:hypothetical protein